MYAAHEHMFPPVLDYNQEDVGKGLQVSCVCVCVCVCVCACVRVYVNVFMRVYIAGIVCHSIST